MEVSSAPVTVKGSMFYTELVCVTIFSLLASSIWIELVKRIITTHFNDNFVAIFIMGLIMALIAIFFLNFMFSNVKKDTEKEASDSR